MLATDVFGGGIATGSAKTSPTEAIAATPAAIRRTMAAGR